MKLPSPNGLDRRLFLGSALAGSSAPLLRVSAASSDGRAGIPTGKAEHCILLWMGGGMGHIDTFDPKARGESLKPGKPGSLYDSRDTAVAGVRVCEHLPKTAAVMDRLTVMRTVNHKVIDEHAFATNLVHTGRMISGNVTYPSIGSIVAHVRGPVNPSVPAYILIGYPNVSRGPGFLGARAGFVYLTDTEAGPAGFSLPRGVDETRAARRREILESVKPKSEPRSTLGAYAQAQSEALRLAGPAFQKWFNLETEASTLRESYGGEFGQRCLLARRLVEAGVRFIEVSHNLNFLNGTGWDVHNEGIRNQHLLVQEMDRALGTLILDLQSRQLMEKTLIVVATEFGRPPEFDGRGGRGHQGTAFSMVLAGGGLNHKGAYGVTDEWGRKIVENPVSIPDFHATILATLGIQPGHELMDGGRPVPVTDFGKPVAPLFA